MRARNHSNVPFVITAFQIIVTCTKVIMWCDINKIWLLKEDLFGDLTGTLDGRDTLTRDVPSEASLLSCNILVNEHLALHLLTSMPLRPMQELLRRSSRVFIRLTEDSRLHQAVIAVRSFALRSDCLPKSRLFLLLERC